MRFSREYIFQYLRGGPTKGINCFKESECLVLVCVSSFINTTVNDHNAEKAEHS